MRPIRSAVFNVFFICWTACLLLTLWLLMPFSRDTFRSGIVLWPRLIFPMMRILLGLRYKLEGEENIPDRPVIYAVKHQSAWETMYFLYANKNNAYIMKDELRKIPFWGWYMDKSQHVVVDRKGAANTMRKMIAMTSDILADGRSVVIFPEGTRTPVGETGRYHPGVFALYDQTKAPVVPVAINSGVFWGRRMFVKKPGKITLKFLPPMPVGLDRRAFMAELQDRIETATRALESAALYTGEN
jgi:1-acyl-sn-glycerol-3-phosphate acyltransferase